MSGQLILSAVVALIVGGAVGFFVRQQLSSKSLNSAEARARAKIEEAEEKSKKIVLEAESKAADLLADVRKENREQKIKLASLEERLMKREEILDKKLSALSSDEDSLKAKSEELKKKELSIDDAKKNLESQLEKISGLSREEALKRLYTELKESNAKDLALSFQKLEKEKKEQLEKKAGEIITLSLERYARSQVAESTTSSFPISNEEIKGKIIGREGRNIRALERATGVEFIIDESPDNIIISSFDPMRREIAKLALEKLIKDGRIQPAKIEEKVEEARQEIQKRIMEIGEAAVMELGIYDLPKEIIQLLGRLHFRTSYGQNILMHSIEMAHIASMIAAELGLNVEIAKKGALLHDIGKAIDHEVEGTHVEIGRKLLKKYSIPEPVIEAMQSHHEDYPYAIPEAYVVTAADVLSGARPGARRDSLENYIKRLSDLEKIATDFPGVKQAYAVSAGRELRVFVIPEKVDDFKALEMAREIANRIQSELQYPGEIKVNVIREMRAVEYAK